MASNKVSMDRRKALLGLIAMSASMSARSAIPKTGAVTIGVSGPFSGGSAPMGESMRNGVRLAAKELNYLGGVLGRPIELLERDDQANPEMGKIIAEEFTSQKVLAAIGIVNTGVGLASIDIYQRARIPLMLAVATGPALTRRFAPPASNANYVFRVAPTLDLEITALIKDAKRRNVRRIALLADTTAYGDAGVEACKASMRAESLELVTVQRFGIGDKDMSKQLKAARAANADAIVAWGIGPELAAIARGRAALGWNVPLMGGWTLSMRNFIENAGTAGDGALTTQTFIQQAGNAERNSFLLAYERTFKTSHIPSPMSAAQGYDGMLLLGQAIMQANRFDGMQVAAALESLDRPVRGVITTYEKPFNKVDHEAITANMIVIGKVQRGSIDYAYDEDARRWLLNRRKQG